MAFNEVNQTSIDVNGNIQYVDPMYYLYSLEDGFANLKEIFDSYVGEQKKIDAVINEKYTKAIEATPQHAGSGFMAPLPGPNERRTMSNYWSRPFFTPEMAYRQGKVGLADPVKYPKQGILNYHPRENFTDPLPFKEPMPYHTQGRGRMPAQPTLHKFKFS